MNGLLVIGAGGHGKVVADTAILAGWERVAFLDDFADLSGRPLGLPILGRTADLDLLAGGFSSVVVAVGTSRRRLELLSQCQRSGLRIISVVHPAAFVSTFASLAPGCVVFAQAAVNADAVLGLGCIVNTGATVDHDCALGDGVHVCPGAHLAGNVRIGDCAWIGIGAVVRQGVSVGRDATVGAGGVVVADVPDGTTVVGSPAREKTRGSSSA